MSKICGDSEVNRSPMTMARWTPHEVNLCTTCADTKMSTTFEDTTKPIAARALQPPAADHSTDTNALLTKVLEALTSRQAAPSDNPDPRGGFVRKGGSTDSRPVYEPSCFWCDKKGHTLIDCTGSTPNLTTKETWKVVLTARSYRESRNDSRQSHRMSSITVSVSVSDDEEEDASSEATYAVIQTLFQPTKP